MSMISTVLGLQRPRDGRGDCNMTTWPRFNLMNQLLVQKPSNTPAVLITSLPEDAAGPSGLCHPVGDQEEEEEPVPGPLRKRRGRRKDDSSRRIWVFKRRQRRARRGWKRFYFKWWSGDDTFWLLLFVMLNFCLLWTCLFLKY